MKLQMSNEARFLDHITHKSINHVARIQITLYK